jgi:hypothetical protein
MVELDFPALIELKGKEDWWCHHFGENILRRNMFLVHFLFHLSGHLTTVQILAAP